MGIAAGYFRLGNMAFVGKGIYYDKEVPGRIQIVGLTGLYHISHWKVNYIVDSAQYLFNNKNQTYSWVDAKNGQAVDDAIVIGPEDKRSHIVRIVKGNYVYMGKTHMGSNAHYEDENDKEVRINQYQVLTCTVNRAP